MDAAAGDADGADASPAAAMLLRPAEVPAALVADLLGPLAVAAAGAGKMAAVTGAADAAEAEASTPLPHTSLAWSLPVHAAAAQGDLGLIRAFLHGGRVGARVPGSGEMALHVASSSAAAVVLIAEGAAVSGRNAAGHTALAAATTDDNPRLVAALLDAGAPFDGETHKILTRHVIDTHFELSFFEYTAPYHVRSINAGPCYPVHSEPWSVE